MQKFRSACRAGWRLKLLGATLAQAGTAGFAKTATIYRILVYSTLGFCSLMLALIQLWLPQITWRRSQGLGQFTMSNAGGCLAASTLPKKPMDRTNTGLKRSNGVCSPLGIPKKIRRSSLVIACRQAGDGESLQWRRGLRARWVF